MEGAVMKRLLFVALAVVVSAGCKKTSSDDGQYSGGQNPTVGGAAQAVRGAADRMVTAAELHDLHLFMNTAKLSMGHTPTSQETWDALSQPSGNPKLIQMIKEQKIILMPTPGDEGLWAYAKEAPTQGGWILTHNGPERVTAQEFTTRFPVQ
jgi:hypothetical protein